ncbi:alpha/beta hydrolase, partial [Brevundimonas sp. EAKA]|uniref:alpha/beta fold hydrolase n=1 Tax=Brevundimonas sp. EAKA TaxID=1495854 RepID=UPI0004A8DCF7
MTLAETSLLEEPACRPTPSAAPVRERGGARDVIVSIPADFRLASGEKLNQPNIVGRIHGRAGAPVVVVAGGISAGRFVHRTETNGLGWWSGAVSVRGPIDLSRLQVLAVDFAPGAEFSDTPVTITTHDQARLLALVLNHLKVERVAAFVGCSYGGMVGLAFAELYPDWAEQLIVFSAAHRA